MSRHGCLAVVMNRHETEQMTGQSDPSLAARGLIAKGLAEVVIVKMGSRGARLVGRRVDLYVPPLPAGNATRIEFYGTRGLMYLGRHGCGWQVIRENGEVVEIRCTYDPATRGGDAPDGRKVKATLHWVAASQAIKAEARLYDHLFLKPDPDDVEPGQTFIDNLNPNSLEVKSCYVEPSVAGAKPGTRYQFERQGYFCVDKDSRPGALVFNRTVGLKDTWAKIQQQ